MFCHFWQKFENSKWPPFWVGEIFLKIAKNTLLRYPVVKNFDKIALSRMVKEIETNLCFAIFFLQKFKMAAIFGEGKIF